LQANDALNRIKNVYVRNLKVTTSQQTIFAAFNAIRPGAIERVKKIEDRDYAFVHFLRREDALYAVQVRLCYTKNRYSTLWAGCFLQKCELHTKHCN